MHKSQLKMCHVLYQILHLRQGSLNEIFFGGHKLGSMVLNLQSPVSGSS